MAAEPDRVSECVERLKEAASACSAPCSGVAQQSAALLHLLQDKERKKHLTFPQVEGSLTVLLNLLEQHKNSTVTRNVILILKEVLTSKTVSKQCCGALVQRNGGQVLLSVLLKHREIGITDINSICALYAVLTRMATRDRKLATRARLVGALKVPLEELQRQPRPKPRIALSTVQFLRKLLMNKVNATLLGKEGVIPQLLGLLNDHRTVSLFTAQVLECLAWATRSKRNVLEMSQHGHSILLNVLHDLSAGKVTTRHEKLLVRMLRADLQALLHIAFYKAGRRALLEDMTPERLYSWCTTLPSGPLWNRLIALACLTIQRCMPPLELPVSSIESPVVCPLQRQLKDTASEILTEASLRVDVHRGSQDQLSSGTTSSSDPDVDSDDGEPDIVKENPPIRHDTGLSVGTCVQFFPEMEFKGASLVTTRSEVRGEPDEKEPHKRMSILNCAALLNGAREAQRAERCLQGVDRPETFARLAQSTESVVLLVKLPFPDLHGHDSVHEIELLNSKCGASYRSKLLGHVERCLALRRSTQSVVVYDYDASVNGSMTFFRPLRNTDETRVANTTPRCVLEFESRFESGNLRRAIKVGPTEYDLVLNPDINTNFHHQWFYFEVSGMYSDCLYTFNIINLERSGSLYTEGQCPLLYSVRENLQRRETGSNGGWRRVGEDICYFRNQYARSHTSRSVDRPYYTLSFTVQFPHDGDVCYLAYAYPYSFSLLKSHLHCWQVGCDTSTIFYKQQVLCESFGGNPVPLVTITAQPAEDSRPYIFLSARVHPGETQSSWIMKGVLDFLMSDKPSAQRLREAFTFKVVPMLNPDGVINGCHRCSLVGQDLNRQWSFPDQRHHPTIYHTRALLEYLSSINKAPALLCDFHGHSRRFNIFLYGCSPSQSWCMNDRLLHDDALYEVLPVLLHHVAPAFSYDHCCFDIEHGKESTARVTAWRQFGIQLSYTLECSAAGCDQGMYAGHHLGIAQLEEMGMKFCQALGRMGLTRDKVDGSLQLDPTYPELIESFRNEKSKKRTVSSSSSGSVIDEEACNEEEEGEQVLGNP
ncbi:cytosolic carboxypeptidase 1-like isoform X2 [Ornithodoros turicata]